MSIQKATSFVIPRNQWGRNWLRDGQCLCALGHFSKACGIPVESMGRIQSLPLGDHDQVFNFISLLDRYQIVRANINRQEQEIIDLFAKNGVKVTFEGE